MTMPLPAPRTRCGRRDRAAALAGLLGFSAVLAFSPMASASEAEQGAPEEPDGGLQDSAYSDAVTEYDPSDYVTQYDPQDHIERLGGTAESEDEDVIVLETDILFAAMEWELPGSAGPKIGELVEEIPDGAAVDVHGHTDSNPVPDGYDFDNQVLSENRAEAVAQVLEGERPDLELSVEGFGQDQPAVEEDEEDPDTFAANRRVEIRYD